MLFNGSIIQFKLVENSNFRKLLVEVTYPFSLKQTIGDTVIIIICGDYSNAVRDREIELFLTIAKIVKRVMNLFYLSVCLPDRDIT